MIQARLAGSVPVETVCPRSLYQFMIVTVYRYKRPYKSADCKYVHPGYGFLSENADFAQSIEDQGRTWVGPPPGVLRLFGDKTAARKLATDHGVPVVGGSSNLGSAEEAEEWASTKMSMPVIMKAA